MYILMTYYYSDLHTVLGLSCGYFFTPIPKKVLSINPVYELVNESVLNQRRIIHYRDREYVS